LQPNFPTQRQRLDLPPIETFWNTQFLTIKVSFYIATSNSFVPQTHESYNLSGA